MIAPSDSKHKVPKDVLDQHKAMEQKRRELDGVYQELKDLVRPDTSDFVGVNSGRLNPRRQIFDGTAPWAMEQLAAGLHSYNSSPVDRWFALGAAGVPFDQLSFGTRLELEEASEVIYSHYQDPAAMLNPSLHEIYCDLGTFGTGVIYQWYDVATGRIMFRAFPLADVWIDEEPDGSLGRLDRRVKWTIEQVEKEFGFLPPQLMKFKAEKRDDTTVTVIHAVYRNPEYTPGSKLGPYRRWKSCFFCKDTEEILEEGGYDWMPYHAPRWTRVAGELYGRGPGIAVLPEIRMVNAMSKTIIAAAQKMVDPPLQVPDDGFLLPLRQTPGGLNFRRPGAEQILPMPTAQRIDIGIDQVEQRREMIRRGFYIDWMIRSTKKERQTAFEVSDERNQMLAMMGPIIGRLQNELLGPMVKLTYRLLVKHGELPPPPREVAGRTMDVSYLSPAARAQSTTRGQGMNVFVDRLVQLAPVMPGIMDALNEDRFAAELADQMDVPRRVLESPEAVQQKKQARQQAQQAAELAQVAPAVGSAAKDLASAQQMAMTPPQ